MILLDTNVVSELMKPQLSRSAKVMTWLRSYPADDVFTTTLSLAEVLAGIVILPEGKRRTETWRAAEKIFSSIFSQRILPFDEPAASAFADIMTLRRRRGLRIDSFDVQIAAIAKSRGMIVATHNLVDFEHSDVEIIDPWSD